MSQEIAHHETNTKYVPATAQDHGREIKKLDPDERVLVGVDTDTHTNRYVPAPGRGPFLGLFSGKHHPTGTTFTAKSRGQVLGQRQHEDVGEA